MSNDRDKEQGIQPWQRDMFDVLKASDVAYVGYVPDGGLLEPAHMGRKKKGPPQRLVSSQQNPSLSSPNG